MVGSMFVSSEGAAADEAVKTNEAILLALYEAVHLNRNFISALVTSMPDFDNNGEEQEWLQNTDEWAFYFQEHQFT